MPQLMRADGGELARELVQRSDPGHARLLGRVSGDVNTNSRCSQCSVGSTRWRFRCPMPNIVREVWADGNRQRNMYLWGGLGQMRLCW